MALCSIITPAIDGPNLHDTLQEHRTVTKALAKRDSAAEPSIRNAAGCPAAPVPAPAPASAPVHGASAPDALDARE